LIFLRSVGAETEEQKNAGKNNNMQQDVATDKLDQTNNKQRDSQPNDPKTGEGFHSLPLFRHPFVYQLEVD